MTKLRKLRYEKGLQRKFVADKILICGKHLNDIEAGKVNLTNDIAKRLSDFYHIDIEDIKNMYMEGKNEKCRGIKKTETASRTD